MAATYDASLSTDKDWVRFLIGDTDTSNAHMQDETIEAVLSQEMNVYMAASQVAMSIYMNLTRGGGVEDRKVGETRLRYVAANRFKMISDGLAQRGYTYAKPWAGGIYKTDRESYDSNTDKLKIDIAHGIGGNPRGPGAFTNASSSVSGSA